MIMNNSSKIKDIPKLNTQQPSIDRVKTSDRKKSLNIVAFKSSLKVVNSIDRIKKSHHINENIENSDNEQQILSMSSLDSQNELWENFKKSPRLLGINGRSSTCEPGERHNNNRKQNNTNGFDDINFGVNRHQALLEKYEKNIEKIKDTHRIEIQNLTITFHNKAKDLINNKIEEMRKKFESEVKTLISELTRVKIALKEKENQIARLTIMLDEKQIMIENFERKIESRISHQQYLLKKDEKNPNSTIIDFDEKSNQKDEIIEQLKLENLSLQKVCNIYKTDEDKALADLNFLKNQINDVKKEYEEKIQTIKAESNAYVEELTNKLDNVELQFAEYRKTTALELKILKTVVDRYKNGGVSPSDPVRARNTQVKTPWSGSRGGSLPNIIENQQKNKGSTSSTSTATDSRSNLSTRAGSSLARKMRFINGDENDSLAMTKNY